MIQNLTSLSLLFDEYKKEFNAYEDLINRWGGALNLVSRETLPHFKNRHILDSLQLIPHLASLSDALVVDIGSGAGFPGLVLSIVGVRNILLIESDQKKALFLKTVIRSLGLKARVVCARVENITSIQADYCVSRAFAPLDRCFFLMNHFMHQNTICLFHKGMHIQKELEIFQKRWYCQTDLFPSLVSEMSFIIKISHVSKRS